MKTSSQKASLLRAACGLILIAAASSTVAQQPNPTTRGTTSPTPTLPAPNPVNPPLTSTIPGATDSLPNPNTPRTTSPATPNDTTQNSAPYSFDENRFLSADKNNDRKLSTDEYTAATLAAFKALDRNRDGAISSVELAETESVGLGAASPLSSAQIGQIDSNRDLTLTNDEATSGAVRMFKTFDVDHDGFLSDDELSGRQYKSDTDASADSRQTTTNRNAADNRDTTDNRTAADNRNADPKDTNRSR